eukprot:m.191423 g.191423  ORF g.191423 m.191423 type:complete len:57 (+) comp14842_c0_seq1:181-351(+)
MKKETTPKSQTESIRLKTKTKTKTVKPFRVNEQFPFAYSLRSASFFASSFFFSSLR